MARFTATKGNDGRFSINTIETKPDALTGEDCNILTHIEIVTLEELENTKTHYQEEIGRVQEKIDAINTEIVKEGVVA